MGNNQSQESKQKEFVEDDYVLSSLQRIFFARILDLILSCLPGFLIIFFITSHDWKSALILVSISFFVIFFYFILLAYWLKGNTIGKLIVRIRLIKKNKSKVTFKECFLRELYHLLCPFLFQLVMQIIAVIIFTFLNSDGKSITYSTLGMVFVSLGNAFYLVWFFYVSFTIMIQQDHQSAIDCKLKIYCVMQKKEVKTKENLVVNLNKDHIHLEKKKPGQFDIKEIDKLLEKMEDEDE